MFGNKDRRRRGAWRRRADPTHVRTFAALVLVSGIVQVVRPVEPAVADDRLVDLAVTSIIGLAYWLLAPRFALWALHLVMFLGITLGFGSILRSASSVDAVIISTSLLWTGVLVAAISSTRTSRTYAVYLAAGSSAALLAAGPDEAWRLVVVLGLTTVATMELVNRLSTGLRHAAASDPLTGLRNRAGLEDAGDRLIRESRRSGRPLALAVIDLDGFKAINDEKGHAAGDRLLVDCALAWQQEVRQGDVLARLGGDEFVLMAPNADRAAAELVLQRMADASPTAWTAGLAMAEDADDLRDLLERADLRLVQAKSVRPVDPDRVRT